MSQSQIVTARCPAQLPPMPIDPAWIEEGTPKALGCVLTQSQDKLVSSGFWSCTAGKFRWTFSWDEFVYILEGEVTIREEGGATHTLKAGDSAHFPRGLTTHWHVPKSVRKFFTLRTPEPFVL
ncbi:MAG: cupin domain-containing protein [Planctomycetia bacterium]|nr:cupin domain-containing protein [Planctomycetia bacterium]